MQGQQFVDAHIRELSSRVRAGEAALSNLPAETQKEIKAARRAARRRGYKGLLSRLFAVPLPIPGQPASSVTLIDVMGDDSSILQSARISYGKGTKSLSSDRGLLRYLLAHAHTTPFEMCEIKLRIDCPIFVARQWIRHRTANVNEYSGRYSEMNDNFYIPPRNALAPQSNANKQGRAGVYTDAQAGRIQDLMEASYRASFKTYNRLLGKAKKPGFEPLARELARSVLPVGGYTSFYFKIDLHNLMHFLRLRADSHAQKEIRDFATLIEMIVAAWVPVSTEAYYDYVKAACRLSAMEIKLVNALLAGGKNIDPAGLGLSKREVEAFLARFPASRSALVT